MIWQMVSVISYKFKKLKSIKEILSKQWLEDTPNNQELPLLAAIFTSILCIGFGSNAVAIKISLSVVGGIHNSGTSFQHSYISYFSLGQN